MSKLVVNNQMKANIYSPDTFIKDRGLFQSVKTLRKAYEVALEETNKKNKIADKKVQMKLFDSNISRNVPGIGEEADS